MKKKSFRTWVGLAIVAIAWMLFFTGGVAWGAGECTQFGEQHGEAGNRDAFRTLKFTCVGDSSNGTIPNTAVTSAWTTFIKGWFILSVRMVARFSLTTVRSAMMLL